MKSRGHGKKKEQIKNWETKKKSNQLRKKEESKRHEWPEMRDNREKYRKLDEIKKR